MEQINKPSISVIILTVGRPLLFTRAINSILKQDYPICEIIIGDVSKDSETEMLVRNMNNNKIRYIKIENEKDPALTINYLINEAKGELIAFCDDDDEWISSDKLSKQVDKLNELGNDYGIIYCWYEIWDDKRDALISVRCPNKVGNIFWYMLGDNAIAGTPNLLIRKQLFEQYGGWLEGTLYTTDYLMLLRLSQHTKVGYVPEILVRVHHNHIYKRVTNLDNAFFTHENRINYQLKFIEMFKVYMDLIPASYLPHYRVLIYDYIYLKNFNLAIIYIIKYIMIKGIDKYILKTIIKLVINIINIYENIN